MVQPVFVLLNVSDNDELVVIAIVPDFVHPTLSVTVKV